MAPMRGFNQYQDSSNYQNQMCYPQNNNGEFLAYNQHQNLRQQYAPMRNFNMNIPFNNSIQDFRGRDNYGDQYYNNHHHHNHQQNQNKQEIFSPFMSPDMQKALRSYQLHEIYNQHQ